MNKMKKYIPLLAALSIIAVPAGAKSPKRGVCENSFSLTAEMKPLEAGVSWYYGWGNTPSAGYQNQVADYDGIEFAPMCWNGNYSAENIRAYCKAHPDTRYLLGFNEPNFTNQANMTPQEAAAKWPEVVALARELGLKIVAPALNYSPNPPYQSPTKWFDEFTALVGAGSYDYVAIHGYGGFGVIRDLATTFHERYGKDVWVTEFCYWPGESGYVNPDTQISAMVETVTWLETTEWIHRYAWFKAKGAYNSTNQANFGLIVSKTGYDERELSPQGKVYVYMSDFDTSVWNPVNTEVNAVDYVMASSLGLGEGANPFCGKPIEISRFNSGATADWQFDVPEADDYSFVITVSGHGEPVRFDPVMQVQVVENGEAKELFDVQKFTLPGGDDRYTKIDFPVTLGAGHQTLRLADMAPYTPSGIRISTVSLRNDGQGYDSAVCTPADPSCGSFLLHSLQGALLRDAPTEAEALAGIAPGIYILNGKKIIIK